MNLIMLSGESQKSQAWIGTVHDHVADLFDETHVQQYAHWRRPNGKINFTKELTVLEKQVANWKAPYIVFAKSIGTLLTAKALDAGILEPEHVVLTGIPLVAVPKQHPNFGVSLSVYKEEVTIIQNDNDPYGSAMAVRQYLRAHDLASAVIETVGSTHDYLDLDLIRSQLNVDYDQ
jgi:hypothetical protein